MRNDRAVDGLSSQPVSGPACSAGAWWASLGIAALGISLLTAAVATISYRPPASASLPAGPREVPEEIEGRVVEVDFGRQLFMQNCSSCHGSEGTGMPKQGANLRDSYFVRRKSNEQLVSFLRIGRMPADRDTVLGLTMPPRGGNADLDDGELCDIVAYLRQVQWSHGSRPQAQARAMPSLLGSADADSGRSRRY